MNNTYNLGDILHSYIQKNGYSIYELAKKANISRSMLQKVLSNERKLTKNYLEKLKPFLKISPREYDELCRMSEEIRKGTFDYRTYQLIGDLLISIYETTAIHRGVESSYAADLMCMEEKKIYLGKNVTEGLLNEKLQLELQDRAPQVMACVPAQSDLFCHVLSQTGLMASGCENLNVRQIICLERDKSLSDTAWKNVHALAHVLPNIVVSKCCYEVYYYYGKELSEARDGLGFPYYLIFSDSVVLLTGDCSAALVCTEESVRTYFSNVFQDFQADAVPLVTSCVNAQDILPHFLEIESVRPEVFSLQYQPCLLAYMTEEMIRRYAMKTIPHYEQAVSAVVARTGQLKKLKQHTCYFSKAGLGEFAEHGYVSDFPRDYAGPLDKRDRIRLLEALYEEIDQGRQNHRMINPYTFPVPDTLSCVLHRDVGIDFYGFGIDKKNYNYIFIREPSFLDVFYGFFRYLEESMLVCAKEETLDYIRLCIASLND